MSTITLVEEAAAPSTPATGKVVVYPKTDSKMYIKDDAGNEVPVGSSVLGTKQNASGTSVDFTGIPSWVKRITITIAGGLSTNGTSDYLVQIGDSGGIENTGYSSASSNIQAVVSTTGYTAGFGLVKGPSAATSVHGKAELVLVDAATFTWCFSSNLADSGAATFIGSGSKSLSAVLDRIRITTANGTDTFDSGSINILYE